MSMFIRSNLMAIGCAPTMIHRRARLPLAIVSLLLTVQAQAFLPTPAELVTTGKLALDDKAHSKVTSEAKSSPKRQSAVTDLPAQALPNNNTKPNTTSNKGVIQQRRTNQAINIPDDSADNSIDKDAIIITNSNVNNKATAEQLLASWREKVKTENLAQHTTWRRLLYFFDDQKNLIGKKKDTSIVDDASFFLSEKGQQDSGVELDALLVALAGELAPTRNTVVKNNTANNSVLCRFPARVQWLTDTLNIDKTSWQSECPELDEWMQKLAPEQLSIMFAEEYLDNPISAFGHTLLRIDSKASVADPSQIHHAYALNYTVDGDPDDSFLVYAANSIAGGYDNAIEIDSYPEKLAKYLKDDERDAWTYQLNLTPSEVQQIMLHVWETKDLELPYYFTTDNCASEILRLIDVVRPQQHLLSRLPYAVVPSDVIQLLNEEDLLANPKYTPADDTVRQAAINQANAAAKLGYQPLTKEVAKDIKSAERNSASSVSADGKTILNLPIVASNNNPIDRHPLQMAQIGIGQRGDNNYIDVGVRAGFHDTLDRATGFSQFFNLEGLAATLRFYDSDDNSNDNNNENQPDSVVLQNFTLLRGRSFNPVNSAKQGKTWGVSVEATRVNDGSQQDGTDHLVGSMGYETGWSWAFGTPSAGTGEMPPQLCYTLLSGTGQVGRGINKGFRVGAGVNAGCRYQINNQLRAQAELQLPYWYHGSSDDSNARGHYWQLISSLGLQYDIDKKQALRINANYEWQERVDANDDIQLSYRRYF